MSVPSNSTRFAGKTRRWRGIWRSAGKSDSIERPSNRLRLARWPSHFNASTSWARWRPLAPQGQSQTRFRRSCHQWRTCVRQVGSPGWGHRIDRWPGFGRKLPRIPPWLRRHVLRFTGQNRGLRPVFRFDRESRNKRAAMVCDHFARPARHPHLHAGQRAIARERHPLRPSPIGHGIGWRFRPASRRPSLGSATWLSAPLWPASRRSHCEAEKSPPASPQPSTQTKT